MDNQQISRDWWPSPAKLNLFLHVLDRFSSGYHHLQSLFQILDYGDKLAFDVIKEDSISLSPSIHGVNDEDNLVVKAAKLLKRHTKVTHGVHIYLDKKLPMGGGIGGGSSNAATVLVALNQLWKCELSEDELAELGLTLGADVPIFVRGRTGFAGGVGEDILPAPQPQKWFVVVNPGVHVSTADIFNHPDLPRNTKPIRWDDYNFDSTQNDCQEIVCNTHPEVAILLQWLLQFAPSRMTGTGSCVFAAFDDEYSASRALKVLPAYCSGFIAKGVNLSPLQQKLNKVNASPDTN